MNRFCVYLHRRKDNNEVFYVGQGTEKRPYGSTRKLKKWNEIVKEAGGFVVQVVERNLTKELAIEMEELLIEMYDNKVVNLKTSSSATNHLDFDYFNQRFYVDESSPSGLRHKVDVFAGVNHCAICKNKDDVAGRQTSDKSWVITVDYKPFRVHRIVYLLKYGSLDLLKVIDHIDGDPSNNKLSNLREVDWKTNRRNLAIDRRNKSGVSGVCRKADNTYSAYVSSDEERFRKSFSISKYGEEEAFRLACEWRKQKIEELNAQGAGYTDRHGT